MSIGPNNNEVEEPITNVQRTRIITSKAALRFFKDPLDWLFVFGVAGLLVSLLAGKRPPLEIYPVLIILGIIQVYKLKAEYDLRKEDSN